MYAYIQHTQTHTCIPTCKHTCPQVDGTPVLDVKPYIPHYDAPHDGGRSVVNYSVPTLSVPAWSTPDARPRIAVLLAPAAAADLRQLEASQDRPRLAASWRDALQGV